MARVLAIIPARAGSKRLTSKNKRKLGGKELVRYAIEATLAAKSVDQAVLSSDDEEILAIGREYDRLITLKRPAKISGDRAAAITYVEHALEVLREDFSVTVIVQPSSPFTLAKDVDGTVGLLQSSKADSAVSVVQIEHDLHPVKLKRMAKDLSLLPYYEAEKGRMAAHQLDRVFIRNGSVYASTIDCIRAGKIIGDRCLGYLMPRERSVDINDPLDFAFAEFLLAQRNTNN